MESEDRTAFGKLKDIIVCKNCSRLYVGVAEYKATNPVLEECRFVHVSKRKSQLTYYDVDLVSLIQATSVKFDNKRYFSLRCVPYEGS